MVWLWCLLGLGQFIACSLQNHNLSLAQRRKFSSPEKLIFNRLHIAEAKKRELGSMVKDYRLVANILDHIQQAKQAIDDEIAQARTDMMSSSIKFAKDVEILTNSLLEAYSESIAVGLGFLPGNCDLAKQYQSVCFAIQQFKTQYLDLLMFDHDSVHCVDEFNQKVLQKLYKLGQDYSLNKKYIPSEIKMDLQKD